MTKQQTEQKKGLLIRLDKIGDLVSTVPCDEMMPPNIQCTWMIARGMNDLMESMVPKRNWVEFHKKFFLSQLILFVIFLRKNKFDFAISFQGPWWISFGMWLAGVPQRFGLLSQWHHFLFLNHGIRQKRSKATKHEAEYNGDLVREALEKMKISSKTEFDFSVKSEAYGSKVPSLTIQAPKIWEKPEHMKSYFVIHPGMAGSARNWSQEKYISVITEIFETTELDCVLTGTPADEVYLNQIKMYFSNHPRFHLFQSKLNMKELLDCLDQSKFVIAPSTGVLHLAASLGKKCIGIYSPILVQHPTRWKARGKQVSILVPQVSCPADRVCHGKTCPQFDCMDTIVPKQVMDIL
ncbi:MAG: glycosyltransferase family 9 protein [Pseudobdellovibrionaceae bacterium]